MPAPEIDYYMPDGCYDLPFIYVFDASSLTDGQSYFNNTITIEWDAAFVLRAVFGLGNVLNPSGGGFKLYNYTKSAAMSDPYLLSTYGVVPEKIYPPNGQIIFDLQNVLRGNNACGAGNIYYSLIAFQGVKRYRPGTPGYLSNGPQVPKPFDASQYILRPWQYIFPLTLNWSFYQSGSNVALPRTFTQEVQDYDFELHSIGVHDTAGGSVSVPLFNMQLYDPTSKRGLFGSSAGNAMLPHTYWNNLGDSTRPICFPVPPLVYPVWTQIKFDIQSLVCATPNLALQLVFNGVNRIPKTPGSVG